MRIFILFGICSLIIYPALSKEKKRDTSKKDNKLIVFECVSTSPIQLGNESGNIELTIDFDLKNNLCVQGNGVITSVTELEIECDTSAKISNLNGYTLNRYSGELTQRLKQGQSTQLTRNYKCKKLDRKI